MKVAKVPFHYETEKRKSLGHFHNRGLFGGKKLNTGETPDTPRFVVHNHVSV